ncbi:MAG TPA: hypothetical protein VJB02_05885 [Coxiellaceae bacterium]|nr:hypothetical protein [Coxiellaceae bacterium]
MKKALAGVAVLTFITLLSTSLLAVFHGAAVHAHYMANGMTPYFMIN